MLALDTLLNLFSYLIAVLGVAPLYPHLHPAARLLLPAALLAGIWCDRKKSPPPRGVITAASLILFGFFVVRFGIADLVGASVNILGLLLAVRLLGEKTPRNYLQICAISLFCLAASSLYSLELSFVAFLVLLLVLIAVALVFLTYQTVAPEQHLPPRRARSLALAAAAMPLLSLPLILVFFLILPRTQFPLWNVTKNAPVATGYTDTVQPGAVSSVGETGAVAFRAATGRIDAAGDLYWRGTVLNSFSGTAWRRTERPQQEHGRVQGGREVLQTVYLEPGFPRTVFGLERPVRVHGVWNTSEGDGVLSRRGGSGKARYQVVSLLGASYASEPPGGFYTRVEGHVPPRLAALARRLSAEHPQEKRLSELENFFLRQRITYARTEMPLGPDALDDFLFGKKRGDCEFFASSLALALRLTGVPARLVGGYFGGDYNEAGGYYLVSQDMAHVWVEAYVSGRGWVTVDPTTWAVNAEVVRGKRVKGFAGRARMLADSLQYYWNVMVIAYDLDKQISFLRGAGKKLSPVSLRPALKASAVLLLFVLLAAAGIRLKRLTEKSREQRLLERFMRLSGISPELQCAGLLESARKNGSPAAVRFAEIFGGAVYRDRPLSEDEYRELRAILKTLAGKGRHGRAGW